MTLALVLVLVSCLLLSTLGTPVLRGSHQPRVESNDDAHKNQRFLMGDKMGGMGGSNGLTGSQRGTTPGSQLVWTPSPVACPPSWGCPESPTAPPSTASVEATPGPTPPPSTVLHAETPAPTPAIEKMTPVPSKSSAPTASSAPTTSIEPSAVPSASTAPSTSAAPSLALNAETAVPAPATITGSATEPPTDITYPPLPNNGVGFDPYQHTQPPGTTPDCTNPTLISAYYYELSQISGKGPELVPCFTNSDCEGYKGGGGGNVDRGEPCCVWPRCLCGYEDPVANAICSVN